MPLNGINRNIMECKEEKGQKCLKMLIVLIETLWNVKIVFLSVFTSIVSINRNIMECKEELSDKIKYDLPGINRNIMECKEYICFLGLRAFGVLIETLWNVKLFRI